MPYGSRDEAYKNATTLSHLTAEQAIADFALLITDLKHNLSAEACPVVLFGGSYGGSKMLFFSSLISYTYRNSHSFCFYGALIFPLIFFCLVNGTVLAAWMRLKYPHIAIGALASSAPVLQFEDIVPPETFYNLVSNSFRVFHSALFLSFSHFF